MTKLTLKQPLRRAAKITGMTIDHAVPVLEGAQNVYARLTEDELEAVEDRCKSKSGYVCLLRDKLDSEWVKLQQTPHLRLLQSWLERISLVPRQEIVRSWRHDDRFEALAAARARLSTAAEARQMHADGSSEFFKVTIEAAIQALETT